MKPGSVNLGAGGAILREGNQPLLVTDIIAKGKNGVNCVSSTADGVPLWFESADIELQPAAEAFGSAMLIPSLLSGRSLTIDEDVSRKWLSNVEQLLEIFHQWWGYPKLMPKARATVSDQRAEVESTALFFSGGVDSFFTLLRSNLKIDLLATVQGFDIPLQDAIRINALRSSLECVVAETGVRSIIICTNLREHPEFARASWEQTHGAALGAVAHTLGGHIDRMLISSSYAYVNQIPWGSHPRTDPLWSSDRLKIVHYGAEFERIDKLQAIANEPLVRRHLRVCWENRTPKGNCSECENCIRTRLVLTECGELGNFPVFEGDSSLARHIDALPVIKTLPKLFYGFVERRQLRPDVEDAVRRLLKRNERAESNPRLLASRIARKLFSWAGVYKR